VVDLQGKAVVPGLIESHGHPIGAALAEQDAPVLVHSISEIQACIRERAARLLKQPNTDRHTPQPPNGKIIKDAKGEPTGLVIGAPNLLQSVPPVLRDADGDYAQDGQRPGDRPEAAGSWRIWW
jgi:predicted amidohydrolase YtcJ